MSCGKGNRLGSVDKPDARILPGDVIHVGGGPQAIRMPARHWQRAQLHHAGKEIAI